MLSAKHLEDSQTTVQPAPYPVNIQMKNILYLENIWVKVWATTHYGNLTQTKAADGQTVRNNLWNNMDQILIEEKF